METCKTIVLNNPDTPRWESQPFLDPFTVNPDQNLRAMSNENLMSTAEYHLTYTVHWSWRPTPRSKVRYERSDGQSVQGARALVEALLRQSPPGLRQVSVSETIRKCVWMSY